MGIIGNLGATLGKKAVNLGATTVTVGAGVAAITAASSLLGPNPPDKPAGGALAALDPTNSPFRFERLSYPLSGLGQGGIYPHFVTFYINARTKSKYIQQQQANTTNRLSATQANAQVTAGYQNATLPIIGDVINFKRKTTRTSQSIRLYMPDTMHWTFRNQWKDIALTEALPAVFTKGSELGTSLLDAIKSGIKDGSNISTILKDVLKGATPITLEAVSTALSIDRDLALSSFGYAINPNIDVIYGSPDLRTFVFDFVFAPRNSAEADQVLAIIRSFKFHAAPESSPDSGSGRYWIPPTEFDIEFSTSAMGRVATCVLESIDVDYAPNGWAVYSEQLYGQDMPVNIRMQLQFKEIEFITKERVVEGY